MPHHIAIMLGKAVRTAARLRGGGSALPGLFIEKISPTFVSQTLAQLPEGVIVISGTNGKTTTTKMVVALLENQGMKVFTNRTGSNFVRGVAAALLGEVDAKGQLDKDIAVLELDEAHAVKFVSIVKPRYSLLLNVMRDQLDRFGEIDATARLLTTLAQATTDTVVINREDSRLVAITPKTAAVHYFGLDQTLRHHFPNDDELHAKQVPGEKAARTKIYPPADVVLKNFTSNSASFVIDTKDHTTSLAISGVYNIFNAAAALALVRAVRPTADSPSLLSALSKVTPAFGRGETLTVGGQPLEIILVKNPAGFRLALESYDPAGYAHLIAINDSYADGRDMSWLWDVDFGKLDGHPVQVSGIRAYDMVLRLQYEEVAFEKVDPDLSKALGTFLHDYAGQPKRLFCTYTAMLALRRQLAKITDVEVIS